MNNIILGNGLSGLIIASILDYNNQTFKIYASGKYTPQNIALLKYDSNEELQLLSKILKIEDLHKYTKHIKIGYKFGEEIFDKAQPNMITNYLVKQNRTPSTSSMSDGANEYDAILLNDIYEILYTRYADKIVDMLVSKTVVDELLTKQNLNIYNTILQTECNDNECTFEFVVNENNNMYGFDYIYDCNINSTIKRYTASTIEYFSDYNVYRYKTIKNYYKEPKVYKTCYLKNNINWYDISRNATKTQLKQKDIIYYLIKELGIKNE